MSHHAVPRGFRLPFAVIVIAALAIGCSAASAPQGLGVPGGGTTDTQGQNDQAGAFGAQPAASAAPAAAPGNPSDVVVPDLQIIKTGNLSIEVAAIDEALAAASSKISALGGYVSGSELKGDGDQAGANVVYRIPAAQWDAALVALRALGTKVLAEQTQTQDVTGQVVDLGARITNLQATEAALQAIMTRATKISDVLEVQAQLTDVRGQIEQLTTERKHLTEQAAYSTLTVAYSLKAQAAVVASQKKFSPNDEIDKASASLVDVLQALATAGIWFAIVWLPILLALGVLGLLAVLVLRRFVPLRRAETGLAPIPPAPTAGEL